MAIKNDTEFEASLEQLTRLYRAIRHEFSKVKITEANASKILLATGKILDKATDVLGEIEQYSGAGDVRIMNNEMRRIRQERAAREKS